MSELEKLLRSATDEGGVYLGDMNAKAALAELLELRSALHQARKWLSGWASAEKELAVIDAALAPQPNGTGEK